MQEREILFRGKRVDNGEWIYGDLIQVPTKNNYSIIEHTPCAGVVEVIPETVGQYTGLTDKNGKKIFEGDILYDEYNECNCLITFDEGSFCFVDDNVCQSVWGCSMTGFEVIGNIHDNPEALEEDLEHQFEQWCRMNKESE